jgi:dsDNA-specific endonuclease/ATPase MutS2
VDVATLGGKPGRVVELREGSAVVSVGAIKMTVPIAALAARACAAVVSAARTTMSSNFSRLSPAICACSC